MLRILVFSVLVHILFGQYTLQSNEFYTAFPRNGNYPILQSPKLHITTTEDTAVNVTLTTSIDIHYTVTIQPHTSAIIDINTNLIVTSNSETNKGIHIKAANNKQVSVYATSYAISTSGGFPVLPLHSYNDLYIPEYIYYAFSAETDEDNFITKITGMIILVAGANNTSVTITPTQEITIPAEFGNGTAVTVQAGESITVTLNSMQTLLLNSLNDLSGSKMISNKPLSVISGHECGIVPPIEEHCDHMVQQIPPSVTWGRKHMAMPFLTRNSGALFKIITHSPDNEVNITCNDALFNNRTVTSIELSAGKVHSHLISNDEWCSFVSKYPLIIAQYAFGGEQEEYGDPMMIILTPLEQYTQLTEVITPTTPLKQSTISNKNNLIGVFVLDKPENITLDNTPLDSYNWTTVYDANDNVLGYGLSVSDVSETFHQVTASSEGGIKSSVIVYGFSSERNGFGYQVNRGMDPISLPWYISFIEHNYTTTENKPLMIPVKSSNTFGDNVTVSVQICQGTPPLDNVMFDNTITFTGDNTVQYIQVIAMDDVDIELMETLCLELTSPTNEHAFLHSITQTTVIIRDDDRVHLTLTQAKIINEGVDVELTLRLSGYEGETVGVSIDASISDGMQQQYTPFTSFTVYFTKYLTEVRYSVPLQHPHTVTDNSMILIELPHTEHNISLSTSTVHIQPSPMASTDTPSPSHSCSPSSQSQSSVSIMQASSTTVNTMSPRSTTTPVQFSTSSATNTRPTNSIGGVQGNSGDGTIHLDPYVVYLIIGLVALLALFVFMLIAAVGCLYFRIRGGQARVDDQLKYLKKTGQTPSSAELLAVAESSFESPSHNRFSRDSAVYISSSSLGPDGNITRSNSPEDNPAINGGAGEAPTVTNKILLRPVENSSSPTHSSLAGSNDNLLQQNKM